MSFKDLRQPQVAEPLLAAIQKGHLAHALLFEGPEAAPKRQAAVELAKALFCERPGEGGGCGSCDACRWAEAGAHPDLFILEPKEESRSIKIEEARELIARTNLKPMRASAKVFVIDRAELMGEDCQNALLKTLEEPQGRSHLVLLTADPSKLLVTIRSRTQVYRFASTGAEAAADPAFEKLKKGAYDFVFYGIQGFHFTGSSPQDPLAKAPELSKVERDQVARLLDHLIECYRDLLVLNAGANALVFSHDGIRDKQALARGLGRDSIVDAIERLSEAKERIKGAANIKLAMADLWASLISRAQKGYNL